MRQLKIFLMLAFVLVVFSTVLWATESSWSAKLATLTVTEMDPDDMWMGLFDPNGTPTSGLIGRTEALRTWPGSVNITSVGDVVVGTINRLANDESTDGTLTVLGQVHIRGDEDRISLHVGAGGEVAGEVTISVLPMASLSFDPGNVYDSNAIVPLFKVHAKKFPNGIIIDYVEVDCMLDPDVEMNWNLGYSNNWDDVGDPNLMLVMDTTNGLFSEDTDANINGGAVVAAGTVVFGYFDADPEGTCNLLNWLVLFHSEED